MPLPYPAYVINLDRQPERYARFVAWNGGAGVGIERVSGSDGATMDEATRATVSVGANYTPGAVGVAHAHKRLWAKAAELGRPVLVFEDDAVLRGDFADALPPLVASLKVFWDIILLGVNTDAVLVAPPGRQVDAAAPYGAYPGEAELARFRDSRDPPSLLRLQHAFGLCGYLVSPKGAARLSERCFPMRDTAIVSPVMKGAYPAQGLDSLLNAHYAAVEAFVCWPPLVLTPNEQKTSGTLSERLKRKKARRLQ